MTMIPFDMTARDYYVAGCIRRGIREHRARLNERGARRTGTAPKLRLVPPRCHLIPFRQPGFPHPADV